MIHVTEGEEENGKKGEWRKGGNGGEEVMEERREWREEGRALTPICRHPVLPWAS